MTIQEIRLHTRADTQWEQVVFAEVLIPETPNVYNDYWTRESIKEFAYGFMKWGFGVDVEHDNVDVSNVAYVVESFLARDGDPDFIAGSWVVGMKIEDAALWQAIVNNDINGYSYQALLEFLEAKFVMADSGLRTGTTEEVLGGDGHVHSFAVLVDENNRPITGGTDEVNGHAHLITTHTVTDAADEHTHRYNLVTGKDGK